MQTKSLARTLLSVALLGGTALGLINTYSNNSDVVRMAEALACGDAPCSSTKIRETRGPVGQSFSFQTLRKGQSAVVDIDCRRELYLIGDYSCARATP